MSTATLTTTEELHPTGIEGATDTNWIPWIAFEKIAGLHFKPLRASSESGSFSVVLKLDAGSRLPPAYFFSGMDLLVLAGQLAYRENGITSDLVPGTWGYISATSRVAEIVAAEDTELLANFYGACVFLDDQDAFSTVLSALDILSAAHKEGVNLVPNTLATCMEDTPVGTQKEEPLRIAQQEASRLVVNPDGANSENEKYSHPHFVDTRDIPWIVNEDQPDIALKIMRVSEETGYVSLIVRHNGVAGPHAHLGAGDFLILHGRLGYRAGPPEGYGPGVWVFEPAGARHEATQRVGDDDLIYTANLYGPIAFDSGPGTPVVAILSWMEYKALAELAGAKLVPCSSPNDASLLAWAPL